MGRLEGKAAIVTGAGRGIGRGIALRFGLEGAQVAVVDLLIENARQTAGMILEAGGKAIALYGDVSKSPEVDDFVTKSLERFETIDILVNNAGIGGSKTCLDTAEEEWDRMIAVNLKSIFLTCKRVIPEMLKVKKGKIINIASAYGLFGSPHTSAYSAAKAGVINLTRQLAVDYSPMNIYVNALSPGLVETEMTQLKMKDPHMRDYFLQFIPLGRHGTPADIAGAALFLASEDSDFITGHNLVVDGGETVRLE
jgi:NAD(P)-dependent dehydrogenase (short-subunit alcohol dehydrogenase family)